MEVILSDPVKFALSALGREERDRLQDWFDHLRNWEHDEFVRSRAQRLPGVENVYVLKSSADLRVFFSVDEQTITVLDVAHRDTIKRFAAVAEQGRS